MPGWIDIFLSFLSGGRKTTPVTPYEKNEIEREPIKMLITVDRYLSNRNDPGLEATFSRIYIDGKQVCVGLEDMYQPGEKVYGETRIPAGKYTVELRTVGGFHSRYASRYKDIHHGMIWVRNVPGFEYILIHIGNYARNTEGCLLVGTEVVRGSQMITSSTSAYKKFYGLVWEAARDNNLEIEYVDNDAPA